MKSSISDGTSYERICERMSKDETFFKDFKQNQIYNEILEHVTKNQGQDYLNIINKEYSFLLKKIELFKENDKQGSPKKYYYDGIGEISPSTLRYIKVLGDLIKYDLIKDNIDIVEIGGGYGGQSKIILDYFNIKKYTIIDLKSPLALTEKYLKLFNNDDIYDFKDAYTYEKTSSDLVISNYAFSECNKNVEDDYIEKIINETKHGYMTINYLNNSVYTVDEIIKRMNKDVKIVDETPLTFAKNKIIIW